MELSELQQILGGTSFPLFFGGSFNPFHCGHRAIVLALQQYFPTCPITLLPNRRSPLKPQNNISVEQKIALMQAVLQDLQTDLSNSSDSSLGGLRLELCELRRAGPSYTADTLRHLLAHPQKYIYGTASCLLVLGWDSFCTLEYWRDWPYLLQTCILLVFGRQSGLQLLPRVAAKACYFLLELNEPYSSSKIRQLLAQRPQYLSCQLRRYWEKFLGPRQLHYIEEQGLYSEA